ncbi:MAG: hypothetical protein N2448_03325 [Caloramator sp.]|nr:hypothetical protein [Caloramator sp.]
MTSKKYNRYFIIFQEEDKGFGIALDKQPTGYTKIETRNGKCKITVYVQNLVKDKGPYICCMIDGSKNPAVVARLGEIAVDDTGRGETFWEYKEEDIAGTGMTIDKFMISAVIVEGDKILSPLAGYASKEKIEWREKFQVENKENSIKERKEIKEEELIEEARKFREYEEQIKKEVQRENDEEENREDKKDEEDIKEEQRDDIINEDNVDMEKIEEGKEYEEYELTRGDKVKKRKTHAQVFHRILKDFEEAYELCDDLKGYRWWKIPFKEEYETVEDSNYPYYCTIYHPLMAYPYINYIKYIKKIGHYYFGIKYDNNGEVKAIVYGIEGRLAAEDQPYMGMTGFTKWFKMNEGEKGLWAMFYNPYTGCIMIPKS